jgi:hypothetical protein
MKNKYRNMHKIIKVFESCETYAQWNNTYNWFMLISKKIFNSQDHYNLFDEVQRIWLNKELKH